MQGILNKFNYKDLTMIAIGLIFLAVAPFFIAASFHDSQRLISIILTTAALFYSMFTYKEWSKNELLCLLTFLSISFVTLLNSLDPLWSAIEVMLFLSILLFSISFIKEITQEKIKYFAFTFILIQAVYLVRGLVNYTLIIITDSKLDVWEVIDGFDNIRFYAQFLSWTLPFVLGYLTIRNADKYKSIIIVIASLSFSLAFLSGTRAFILGIIFTFFSVFIFTPNLWWRYVKCVLLTAAIGLAGYLLMVFTIPVLFGIDNQLALDSTVSRDLTNSSGRVTIWIETINIALNHPWLGIGPMMTAVDGVINGVAHPHNFIFQLMAEWGIPFALLFIFLSMFLALKWKKLIAQNPLEREPLALPIIAALSSAFAASLVDGVMVMPVSLVYMSIVVGAGMSLIRSWTPELPVIRISSLTRLTLLLPISLLLISTIYQWSSLEIKKKTTASVAPRFWSHGKLANDFPATSLSHYLVDKKYLED